MAQVTAERGAGQVTVAHIVARSGVSRRTFYELFADREECLLAALDQAIAHATEAVLPAYGVEGSWRERIHSGLAALLRFVDEEPAQARLCIVESLGAGPEALERRTRVVHALIAAVEEGRKQARVAKRRRWRRRAWSARCSRSCTRASSLLMESRCLGSYRP